MNDAKRRLLFDVTVWLGALAGTFGLLAMEAHADAPRAPLDATYRAECGTCHVAFPPRTLDAPSWQRLMGSLDTHFGTDASLEPAPARAVGDYLARHAGGGRSPGAGAPRVTTTAWFRREHREVPATAWASTAVRTASNCAACHPGAAAGDFDEHAVRIPRS